MQTVNFIIAGLMVVAFALQLGVSSAFNAATWIAVLIFGVAFISCGVIPTDLTGSEDSRSLEGTRPLYGIVHDLIALVGCMALFASGFAFAVSYGSSAPVWSAFSAATVTIGTVSLIAAGYGFSGRHSYGGILQRIAVSSGFMWLSALALQCLI